MTEAPDQDAQQKEGVQIALETLARPRASPGIRGVPIPAVQWEAIIPGLVEEVGIVRNGG